jgi:3-methyladenine DNA glycosylase AlkD
MVAQEIRNRLEKHSNKEKAVVLQRFFKTGRGEYGEGDIFLGIMVPRLRKLTREFGDVPLSEILLLLKSSIHEERLLALMMLVRAFSTGDETRKMQIFDLYLKNTKFINSWDLVDLTAPNIVGTYLTDKSRRPLYDLATSTYLWNRRIAILATFQFIKQQDFNDTMKLSKILLTDEHDLIHKAVGWMLREIGKRSLSTEERFLKQHYNKMPRTMLRYAIERFPETKRKKYLHGKI